MLSLNRALSKNGLLYIRCPSNEPLVGYARHVGSPYPYVHLRTYAPTDLRRAVIHSGFEVLKSGYTPRIPLGYARRSFFVPGLRYVRAQRHFRDLRSSMEGKHSPDAAASLIDNFLQIVESITWRIAEWLPSSLPKRITAFHWYRPSESFIVARKRDEILSD